MKRAIAGLVIVVLLLSGFYWTGKARQSKIAQDTEEAPTKINFEMEEKFKGRGIELSDSAERIELIAVGEAEGTGWLAVEEEGDVNKYYLLADLEVPEAGFYQVWLEGETGWLRQERLVLAKGGWMSSFDVRDGDTFRKIMVSLERLDDNLPEKVILSADL
ncbi:hypothetical protein HY333_01095 [Candidatus Collierbacteria bacterium]|nr:hypothetical protein [Candidatus Collierbacteria bacterium]